MEEQDRIAMLSGLSADELLIHEVFASIQGESSHAGLPCVFVRTTGCHLRCSYCDTRHAYRDGRVMSISDVCKLVESFGIGLVEVTGGEPLLQPAVPSLLATLCDEGYRVLLETSGSLDIGTLDPRVIRITDFKAPSSGEEASNRYENINHLRPSDEIKLVLASQQDYEWARHLLERHRLAERCGVLMGVVFGRLEPRALASWILRDRLPVRLQLQLHKLIWEPNDRGV